MFRNISSGWTARACLLAWLVLSLGTPIPASILAGDPSSVEPDREDSAPEDVTPTKSESPEGASLFPGLVLKRFHALDRSEALSATAPSEPDGGATPRLRAIRTPPGHFLAIGRMLRLRIGSLTC